MDMSKVIMKSRGVFKEVIYQAAAYTGRGYIYDLLIAANQIMEQQVFRGDFQYIAYSIRTGFHIRGGTG